MSDNEEGYIQPDITLLNEDHVKRYRETNGEEGYLWNGATALLLTTIGRKSGQRRTTPLIFAEDAGTYIVVASKGGAPNHPAWYLNVSEAPEVEIQIKEKVMKATAVATEGDERNRLWSVAAEQWPNYNQYAERTDRLIPVVKLIPEH